eukprot:363966-Chlamydomonas_euryale.AAC.8
MEQKTTLVSLSRKARCRCPSAAPLRRQQVDSDVKDGEGNGFFMLTLVEPSQGTTGGAGLSLWKVPPGLAPIWTIHRGSGRFICSPRGCGQDCRETPEMSV